MFRLRLMRAARTFAAGCERLRGTEAIAIAEFAITLPLLLVLVVGIFDFSTAINLKQKLGAASREGARFGSTLPTNDLDSPGTPDSVVAIKDQVDSYLKAARIDDCGLATATAAEGPTLVWTYTANTGCPGGQNLTLTIDRGSASFPATIGGDTINVISTQVTIGHPYQWEFNRVIGLLVPNATYAGISTITTTAVAPNLQ